MIFQILSWVIIILVFFFRKRKDVRILLVTICITLFSAVYLKPTTTSLSNWCILCFFISELKYVKSDIKILKTTSVIKNLLIVLLLEVVSIPFSPHIYGSISGLKDLVLKILTCDFLIVYSYLSVKSRKQLKKIYQVLFVCLIILTFFAVLNLLTKSSFFLTYIGTDNVGETSKIYDMYVNKYIDSERFRVQSTFLNPFDYGYICLVYLCFELYGFLKKIQQRKYSYIAFSCCLFGIFTCGCRTIIFCFLIAVIALLFFLYSKNTKRIAAFAFGAFFFLLLYSTVPLVQSKINLTFTAITDTKGDQVGGSNISLRSNQINAVFFHIKNNLLFGRGVGYFGKDLGYYKGVSYLKDERLMGLEGIYMEYLLERGLVGLVLWILYFISLLFYFYKMRVLDICSSAFGITIIIVYICFSCMTGQLLSLYPTLLSLGFLMRICDSKRKSLQRKNNFKCKFYRTEKGYASSNNSKL